MPFTAIAPSANFISPYNVDVGVEVINCLVETPSTLDEDDATVVEDKKDMEGAANEQPKTPIAKYAIIPKVRQ